MYESPITITERIITEGINDIGEQMDNAIYQVVCKCGITVDKEKLLEALNYSYAQYHIGYADGFQAGAKGLVKRLKEELAMHGEILLTIDKILYEMGCVE